MPDNNQEQIDDIVAMLDQFMADGGGHMNVVCDGNGIAREKVVKTFRSTDCGLKNMACSVPTLHKGFDDEQVEETDYEQKFESDLEPESGQELNFGPGPEPDFEPEQEPDFELDQQEVSAMDESFSDEEE